MVDRNEEIMALYAEVKRLKTENDELRLFKIKAVEEAKREADNLMMAKVTKYENEILRLKSLMHGQLIDLKNAEEMRLKLVKELKEVKDDNKKLAKQIEDIRVDQGGWR